MGKLDLQTREPEFENKFKMSSMLIHIERIQK